MSDRIKVKCDHCNHESLAPRSAAGRRGKCPHCKNSVYVPTPPDELEEIPLAPLDADEKQQRHKIEEEDRSLTDALLREQADSNEGATPRPIPAAAWDWPWSRPSSKGIMGSWKQNERSGAPGSPGEFPLVPPHRITALAPV